MSHALIGRWEDQLTELVEVEASVLCAVIFSDDIIHISHRHVKILLAHEVEQVKATDLIVAVDIN